MSEELVSIIVPIFNVEEYLYDCLQSIQNQTYHNFEVLLIDDGSTDKSNKICRQFSKVDNRFLLYEQNNMGISYSRNLGIKISNGKYLLFVDPDDMVVDNLLEKSIKLMSDNDIQVVSFGYSLLKENTLIRTAYSGPNLGKITSEIALKNLLSGKFGSYVWKMFVKKSLYIEEKIKFPVSRNFEDIATTYKILGNAGNIYITSERLYIYRQREGSITKKHSDKDLHDMLITFHEMNKFIVEEYPYLRPQLINYEFNLIFMLINRMGGWENKFLNSLKPLKKQQRQYLVESNKILRKIYIQDGNDKNNKKKQRLKMNLLHLKIFPILVALKSKFKRG